VTPLGRHLRLLALGIAPEETSFPRRGFREGDGEARRRLERVGLAFLEGYHAALEADNPATMVPRLERVEAEFRGFAYEGSAMALALLDHLTPWRRDRLRAVLDDAGRSHAYMVHVGAGWAIARLPWLRGRIDRPLARLDPLLRWLAVDGYGFHEGYFHRPRCIEAQGRPRRLSGYARRAFDQGLGRSLWFVEGADVERIPATIAAFPPSRRADLWSGVGLARAYTGGAGRAAIGRLRDAAGPDRAPLAQGAAFAAKARQRAGIPAEHTASACEVLCGLSADEAARVTDEALADLPPEGPVPAYETWRRRIQARWTEQLVRL
jgi:hypothetical protein